MGGSTNKGIPVSCSRSTYPSTCATEDRCHTPSIGIETFDRLPHCGSAPKGEHYVDAVFMNANSMGWGGVLPFGCFLEGVLIGYFILCSDDRLQLNDFLEGVRAATLNGYNL